MRRWIQIITVFFIIKPFLKFRYIFKVYGAQYVKNLRGPLLIVTNHKHFIDSFVFGAALPPLSKLFPVRFMGEVTSINFPILEFLRKLGIIKLIYWVFGVVPAIRGKGLNIALKKPIEILREGGIFLIHPEGEVIKGDKIGEFKRGAPVLALKTEVPVLPVAFKLEKGHPKKYSVNFGEIFHLPKNLNYEEGTKYMRKIILNLYKNNP